MFRVRFYALRHDPIDLKEAVKIFDPTTHEPVSCQHYDEIKK